MKNKYSCGVIFLSIFLAACGGQSSDDEGSSLPSKALSEQRMLNFQKYELFASGWDGDEVHPMDTANIHLEWFDDQVVKCTKRYFSDEGVLVSSKKWYVDNVAKGDLIAAEVGCDALEATADANVVTESSFEFNETDKKVTVVYELKKTHDESVCNVYSYDDNSRLLNMYEALEVGVCDAQSIPKTLSPSVEMAYDLNESLKFSYKTADKNIVMEVNQDVTKIQAVVNEKQEKQIFEVRYLNEQSSLIDNYEMLLGIETDEGLQEIPSYKVAFEYKDNKLIKRTYTSKYKLNVYLYK